MKAASSPLIGTLTADTKLRYGLSSTNAATVIATDSVIAYLAIRIVGCPISFIPFGKCIARKPTPVEPFVRRTLGTIV